MAAAPSPFFWRCLESRLNEIGFEKYFTFQSPPVRHAMLLSISRRSTLAEKTYNKIQCPASCGRVCRTTRYRAPGTR